MSESRAILVVEDNPADIYLMQTAVAECGDDLWLWLIPNGRDALTFLRKEGMSIPPRLRSLS